MKIRSTVSWGAIGAAIFIAVGILAVLLGEDGGFWGNFFMILSIPAVHIWAMLLSLFFGTVEGPPSGYRIYFLIYMGTLGFFVGSLSRALRMRWRRRRGDQNDG